MQSKCHQKGKNNQVCGLPCPKPLSFYSIGNAGVGGGTDRTIQISQSVAATTVNTVNTTGVAGPGTALPVQTSGDLLAWPAMSS